jgi:DNA-binding MurR/RpiR family transcriptional regulator
MNIHHHYDQLTKRERDITDWFFRPDNFRQAEHYGVPLAKDDRIERAVDALARAIIESRKP